MYLDRYYNNITMCLCLIQYRNVAHHQRQHTLINVTNKIHILNKLCLFFQFCAECGYFLKIRDLQFDLVTTQNSTFINI